MGNLMPVPTMKFFDANGLPLAGGQLFSYQAGTATPQATYTDADQGTPNANPQILDANGEAVVWLGSGAYKFILKDALNNVLWTRDKVATITNGTVTTVKLADGSVTTVKIADANVTTVKILDQNITTAKIADNAITAAKIPDGGIPFAKLAGGTTELAFADTSEGLFGGGPRAFPRVPWLAPTLVNPDFLPAGDGLGIAWSPNGYFLAVAQSSVNFYAMYRRSANTLTKTLALEPTFPLEAALGVAWSPDGEYVIFPHASSPYFRILQKIGKAFVSLKVTATAGAANAVAWSPDGNYVAIAHATAPYLTVLHKQSIFPMATVARCASANGQSIANNTPTLLNFENVFADSSSAVAVSPWTFTAKRSNGFKISAKIKWDTASPCVMSIFLNGVQYSEIYVNDIAQISAQGSDWIYLLTGDAVTISIKQTQGGARTLDTHNAANYVSIAEDPGFLELPSFTKLTDPLTQPTGTGHSVAWSPDSQFVAIGHTTAPYVSIYQRVGNTLTKCADPATTPTAQVQGLAWSPDGKYLVCCGGGSPVLDIYQLSTSSGIVFTKITNPTTMPTGTANGAAWFGSGDLLAIAHDTTPFITIYSWDGATFTKLANPSSLPPGNAKGVSWSPEGKFLAVAHTGSPYITIYQTSGTIPANSVLFEKAVNLV